MSLHRDAHWPLDLPAPAADDSTTLVFVLPPKIGAHVFPPDDPAEKTLQVHVHAPASQQNLLDFLRALRQAGLELLGSENALTRADIKITMARMSTYLAVGPNSSAQGLRMPISTGALLGVPGFTLILSATTSDLIPLTKSVGIDLLTPKK